MKNLMKLISLIFFCVGITIVGNSQSITSGYGTIINSNGYRLNLTIGEPIINNITSTSITLHQGFHQTYLLPDSIMCIDSIYQNQVTICVGDSIILAGSYQSIAGVYYDTLSTNNMCDSIIETTLSFVDSASNVLSGFVYYQGIPISAGEVRLIRKDANSPQSMYDVDSTFVDATGYFEFDSLPPANYLIRAKGDTALYDNVATYGDSTNHWQWANNHDLMGYCKDTLSGMNVYLIDFPTTIGFGNINGLITNGGPGRAGDPIPGIDIALEQIPGGIIVGSDRSDENGKFQFKNIEQGQYRLYGDVIGYVNDTIELFAFDGTTLSYDVNLCIEEDNDTLKVCSRSLTSIENLTTEFGMVMYPNPTNGNLYIEVNSNSFQVEVKDITGKVVLFENVNESFTKLNLQKFESGVYVVNVLVENKVHTKKLVLQK